MIRVGTYNLYLGADLAPVISAPTSPGAAPHLVLAEVLRQLTATSFERRAPLLARVVAESGADLLGLQEVCTWRVGGAVVTDFEPLLLAALEELGTPYDVVARQPSFGGSAALPTDPGAPSSEIELEGADVLLRRRGAPVEVEARWTGRFATALSTPSPLGGGYRLQRGWCAARVRTEDGPLVVVTTHVEAHDPPSRDRQVAELLEAVAALPGGDGALVVVGDLNATREELSLPGDLVDAWTAAGNDPAAGATSIQDPDLGNPTSRLDRRIDHVLVRGLTVRGCRTLGGRPEDRDAGLWPSDHAAVVAELARLAGPAGAAR